MREVLFPSCTPQERRPKCRAEGLDRPVYIGLGLGLGIHQTPGQSGTGNYHWSMSYRRIRVGWYTAGRMADMGSLSCGPDWVTCAGTLELDGSPGC